jgi:hypothetical protein
MSFWQSLFSGVKAFFEGVVGVAMEVVRVFVSEIDRSDVGRAATELMQGATRRVFVQAQDLAGEEQELSAKRQRDGRVTERDSERLREIEAERDQLRKALDEAKAREAAQALRDAQGELITAPLTPDETSASVGILSSRTCPECGATMRIRQSYFSLQQQRHSFYWQCTASRFSLCPTLKLDPDADQATVIRRPDADLDGSSEARRREWNKPATIAQAHGRLRSGLGDTDEEMICPKHLLPMKLMPNGRSSGLMLDSYAYMCLGVNADGRACEHNVPVTSFPQVSATLRRREGRGILDN